MVRPRNNLNYSGNRASARNGAVFQAAETKSTQHVIAMSTEWGTVLCEVCEVEVQLRKDGSVGSHRIGTTRLNSWPCPGAGKIMRPDGREV